MTSTATTTKGATLQPKQTIQETTMSDEYTPTTEVISTYYGLAIRGYSGHEVSVIEGQRQFARWLAAHDAEVKAAVWDECLDEIDKHELNVDQAREGNPYRKAAPNE